MTEIEEAVKILKSGGILVYPTDTVYGLAVDATNVQAVKKLYQLKGRTFKNPIHVIFPSGNEILKTVALNTTALKLMNKFWPGPLTIVLPLKAKGKSWQMLSANSGTIGIRYPANQTVHELVELLGRPITTTSANLSGHNDCYSINEVEQQFAKSSRQPDFYLDGGKLKRTKPSTVVLITNNHVKILRPGPVSEIQINKALK